MPSRSVSLTDHFEKFVDAQVRSGIYKNASEVVRAALRLLENQTQQDKQKLARLKRLVKEGFDDIERGDYVVVEEDDLEEFLQDIGRKSSRSNSERLSK